MTIQQTLILKILQPLQRITSGWSQKTKDCVFVLCGLLLFFHYFLYSMYVIKYRFLVYFTINCVFLGGMILCSLSDNMEPIKFHPLPTCCWFGIGFLMLLAGCLVTRNRLPEAMLFLVAYPICFIVWNNIDWRSVFALLSRTCVYSFILYMLINILLYPMGTKQYAGLMRNVNGASFYLLLVFSCLLVKLLDTCKFNKTAIWNILLLGLNVALVYYTSSRTGYLAVILVAACIITVHLILHRKEKQRFTLGVLLACCISILICVNLGLYLFQFSKLIPQEWIEWLNLPDAQTSDQLVLDLSGVTNLNNSRFSLLGKSLDQISTGRISIWKAFSADLNLLGNPDDKTYFIPILNREMRTTHNTILQVAYDCGIPAGILYLCFNLLSCVLAIVFARKNRGEQYALLPLAVTIAFGFMSQFSSLEVSFCYLITFYYYLLQFPLIATPKKSRQEVQERT